MTTLSIPGAEINYETWGEGNLGWVTLVNGYTRPLNDFRMMGKKLVEAGYRVLALDNRGAGSTATTTEFSMDDMAGDVRRLWDANGISQSHLLGISMGGFICQHLAATDSGRIRKLVLVSTAPRHAGIRPEDQPWTADIEEVSRKMSAYFTPSFAEKNATLVRSMAKQIASQVTSGGFVRNSELQRLAVKGFDLTSRLSSITVPTLIIHGEEDKIVPVSEGEKLAQGITSARIQKIKGAGHLLLAEAPALFYQSVLEFLKG